MDCLIVGAGLCGLTAAKILRARGARVTLLDKGRGVGGRMATRRIGDLRFDHGAQFFTVRDPRFRAAVDSWTAAGIVSPWFEEGGHTRYRVNGGMNQLGKHLAEGLDVRTSTKIDTLQAASNTWTATTDAGETFRAGAVIVTAPAPQAAAMLATAGVPQINEQLETIEYDPCFALMVELPGPSALPAEGYAKPAQGPIAWIADNTRKGLNTSQTATLTIHANPAFTRKHLEEDPKSVTAKLLEAAAEWIGDPQPVTAQLHRWRYSLAHQAERPACLYTHYPAPLAVAGDAFCGARIEGAFLSGLAAAHRLTR